MRLIRVQQDEVGQHLRVQPDRHVIGGRVLSATSLSGTRLAAAAAATSSSANIAEMRALQSSERFWMAEKPWAAACGSASNSSSMSAWTLFLR